MKQLLLKMQDKNMEQQKEIIERAFEDWQGSYDQVDDVCMIGIRI
jgi:hypothetical protein